MSFSIDKWVLGVFAFFLLACGGNDEKQEINRNDNHEKQVETKSYEIPLSGFELSHINLDSLKDDLRLDSFGHFDAAYHQHIEKFLSQPIKQEELMGQAILLEDRPIKTLLYFPYQPLNGFMAYELPKYNAQFVIHIQSIMPPDSMRSDTALADSLVQPILISNLVELAVFARDSNDVTKPDLVLENGVVIGMHYNELVSKLGIGFVKKGNRLFYNDWKDRVGIFEVDEDGIVKTIIIGRYGIDFTFEPELPAFFVNYASF